MEGVEILEFHSTVVFARDLSSRLVCVRNVVLCVSSSHLPKTRTDWLCMDEAFWHISGRGCISPCEIIEACRSRQLTGRRAPSGTFWRLSQKDYGTTRVPRANLGGNGRISVACRVGRSMFCAARDFNRVYRHLSYSEVDVRLSTPRGMPAS